MFRRALILAGWLALLPATSRAEVLMLVDGVSGPSTRQNHSGWFDLRSLSWHLETKDVTPDFVTATLVQSAAVATLVQATASGTTQKRVVFDQTVTSASMGPLVVMRLTCQDASFREFASAVDTNDPAVASFSIQCRKLIWENFDYTPQGTLAKSGAGSWNFSTNTP